MGRAPCCEKMGLKKGPWTTEEDQILVSFVQQFGHGNWRALPKQAGLLRCGKSCRLRWMNYLRPDIKRGNFTRGEEETIMKLHQVLGNRWSTIAAKLPGRTDNEIKNIWHTHLKKRLHFSGINSTSSPSSVVSQHPSKSVEISRKGSESENGSDIPVSPQYSTATTDLSTTTTNATTTVTSVASNNDDYFPELPSEDFWTHILTSNATFSTPIESIFELNSLPSVDRPLDYNVANTHGHGDGEFWCNLFSKMGEFPELLEM